MTREAAGSIEAAWRQLRLHLRWARRFALILLFSNDAGAVEVLRRRATDYLRLRAMALQHVALAAADTCFEEALAALMAPTPQADIGAPFWLDLSAFPADAGWEKARRDFAVRLNERRSVLERDFHRPLILVFPVDWERELATLAPDLWHVRVFTASVAGDAMAPTPVERNEPLAERKTLRGRALPPEVRHWRRSLRSGVADAGDGAAAAKALFEHGAYAQAVRTARGVLALPESEGVADKQKRGLALLVLTDALLASDKPNAATKSALAAVALARSLTKDSGRTPQSLRDLSLALERLGDVARARSRWEEAEAAYRERHALSLEVVERTGRTPQALRDLSMALGRLGDVARARSRWEEAEAAYRESHVLSLELVERAGRTPQALRGLSLVLVRLGDVAQARSRWEEAEAAYRESHVLSLELVERTGRTPQALRDLSVVLERLGDVAQARSRWEEAEAAYRERHALSLELVERTGRTPQSLRDLATALERLAEVARARGQLAVEEAAWRESLRLKQECQSALGDSIETIKSLAVVNWRLADTLALQGRRAEAAAKFREAQTLYTRLAAVVPEDGRYAGFRDSAAQRFGELEAKPRRGRRKQGVQPAAIDS